MLRVLPVILSIALTVYCLIDLGMTPAGAQVRNLPRWAWVVVILLFPIFGPIAWLAAGRPKAPAGPGMAGRSSGPVLAPDDDPEFLAEIERRRQQGEREKLRKWQAELERRERELEKRSRRESGRGQGLEQGLEQGLDKGKDDPGDSGASGSSGRHG